MGTEPRAYAAHCPELSRWPQLVRPTPSRLVFA
jgi:hypothetical protein